MFVIGDECWRDSYGNPHFTLPWRVIMPDGSTRTDPEQWSKDNTVLNANEILQNYNALKGRYSL